MATLEALIGATDVEVTLASGAKETVSVRALPIRELAKYMAVYDDEASAVELFCARPNGWADTLSVGSFEDVLAAGEALNLDPLARYVARRMARGERVLPGFRARVEAAASATTSPPAA